MQSINRATLLGSLGRDADTKAVGDGTHRLATVSIATSRGVKDRNGEWQTETDWHRVSIWNPHEKLVPLLRKGARVYVEGRLHTRSWDDPNGAGKRYVTEIVCNSRDVIVVGGSQSGNGGSPPQRQAPQSQSADDIPF